MSYCVNCGVELADSERVCPLCQTEVLNPAKPWTEPPVRPYPRQLERIDRIDRQFAAALLGLVLLIPVFVTLLCDLLSDGRVSWSAYVMGAIAVVMVWVLLPLAARRYHQILFLGLDGLSAAAFLGAVCLVGGGHWFWPLALPVTAAATVLAICLVFLFRRPWARDMLVRGALFLLEAGLLVMGIEAVVDLHVAGRVRFSWAPYVLIPCWLLAAAAILVSRQKKLREEIIKRLFY